jgi:hypothetical protein
MVGYQLVNRLVKTTAGSFYRLKKLYVVAKNTFKTNETHIVGRKPFKNPEKALRG